MILLWKKQATNETLVLQKQYINHFGLTLLSIACEVIQGGDIWEDSDLALNLTDDFMIQFDI